MMKIKPLAAAVLLGLGASAHAYQIEVNAGAMQEDFDTDMRDRYTFSVDAIYHLSRVNVANDPLAEAAFMSRSSNISFLVNHSVQGDDDIGESADKRYMQQIGAEYYVPNNMLYFAATVTNSKFDDETEQDVGVRIGLTPIRGLRVAVGWQDNKHDDSDSFGMDAKYVTMLGGYFFNFEASYDKHDQDVDDDDDETFGLSADFYINTNWSVGLAYAEDMGDKRATLSTRKFFDDNIAAGLSYTRGEETTATNYDVDTIALDFTMRF